VTLGTTSSTSGSGSNGKIQGEGQELDEGVEEERYMAALEFLLTLIETADFGPLRKILEQDKGAMVRMLLGRMFVALGEVEREEDDLREWLDADDVSLGGVWFEVWQRRLMGRRGSWGD
jgi:hypothetical protein